MGQNWGLLESQDVLKHTLAALALQNPTNAVGNYCHRRRIQHEAFNCGKSNHAEQQNPNVPAVQIELRMFLQTLHGLSQSTPGGDTILRCGIIMHKIALPQTCRCLFALRLLTIFLFWGPSSSPRWPMVTGTPWQAPIPHRCTRHQALPVCPLLQNDFKYSSQGSHNHL